MQRLVNLTPDDISLYGQNSVEEGPQRIIQASGQVARLVTIERGTMRTGGFNTPPIVCKAVEYGDLENLPSLESGTFYIVSLVCALASCGRTDLLAPYIEVRNDKGTMIGCRYLQKVC